MKMLQTAAAIAFGGMIALAASFALAAIPDAAGVIHGCYHKTTGQLRVIDHERDSCAPGETAIQWNEQGIQGEQGEKGDKGDTGDTGPQGPSGFLGSRPVSKEGQVLPGIHGVIVTAWCAEDEIRTGGAANPALGVPIQDVEVAWSFPVSDGNVEGWTGVFFSNTTVPRDVLVTAICVKVR